MSAVLPGKANEFAEELTVADLTALDWASGDVATRLAGTGLRAVQAFAAEVGGADTEPIDHMVSDLIANLMHLANAVGVNFDYLVHRATLHHRREAAA